MSRGFLACLPYLKQSLCTPATQGWHGALYWAAGAQLSPCSTRLGSVQLQRQALPVQLQQQRASHYDTTAQAAGAAPSSSSLRDQLAAERVSYPAIMSLLHCSRKHGVQAELAVSNIAQLRRAFGAAMVDKMLQQHPLIATGRPELLLQHYEGLKQVLGGDEAAVRQVVSNAPDLLNHAPDSISRRMQQLEELLQISQAAVRQLVLSSPSLLKCRPAGVVERVRCLQQLTGLDTAQVVGLLSRSLVLATTSVARLVDRQRVLGALLQASPEQMLQACRAYPELLSRDPTTVSGTIDSIARHLQIPQEEAAALVRRNPSVLSWNTSTLLNRITVVCQSLRLPPELRDSLLTGQHRPLLSHCADIPQRLECLKEYLGLPESDILHLLSSKLTVLRLTPEQMQSKAAVATSLALLHPAWHADLQSMAPGQKLRLLQLGHVPFWRLVYLVHTGQQDCGTFKQFLNASNAVFDRVHPGFKDWLDRYNSIVAGKDTPLVPGLTPAGSTQPASYIPVLPANPSGRATAAAAAANAFSQGRWEALQQATADSSASGSEGSCPAPFATLPPTPAAMLSAWWGVDQAAVHKLLSGMKGRQRPSSVQQWVGRLQALQALLAVLKQGPHQPTTYTGQGSSSTSLNSSNSSNDSGAAAPSPGSHSSAAAGSPLFPAVPAASAGHNTAAAATSSAGAGQQQLPPARRRRRQQPEPQQQQQLLQQQQQQQQQPLDSFNLLPEARTALQHALSSGSAAAVACVSVACHLAPFSQHLLQLPPKPPEPVVQFVLQHPRALSRAAFAANCSTLASLAGESGYLRAKLQAAGAGVLSQCLGQDPVRLKMVQYLVQTGQPTPWAFTFDQLLVHAVLTQQGKGGSRAAFVAAYPGFQQWDAAMCSM